MKIALAQINTTVGDLDGNLRKITRFLSRAEREGADLCLFPEMAIPGYPCRDLLLSGDFIDANLRTLERLCPLVGETAAVVGFAEKRRGSAGRGLFNAGAFIHRGRVRRYFRKMLLPTYDVFDEARYFDPAEEVSTVRFRHRIIGLSICEDVWNVPGFWARRFYSANPVALLAAKGAELLCAISSSPFVAGREELRMRIVRKIATKYEVPVYYVNQVGGNDQLIFDGGSFVVGPDGDVIARGARFSEDCVCAPEDEPHSRVEWSPLPEMESIHRALVLGISDYARKCGFRDAVVGLSGGIDSAVVACLAVKALGSNRVHGVAMPSVYSSRSSMEDAGALAERLGISFSVIPIEELYDTYMRALTPHFGNLPPGTTEENIQARIRGNILMALSNKFGWLVLSTGNKSETAVGYCTLYGDMTGGLAVISDLPKGKVYALARHMNREQEFIPRRVFTRPPSAELKPGQTDRDTLPPYEILDDILHRYIEVGRSPDEIIAAGHGKRRVMEIVRKVARNEYKREQAPPGLKVTGKAFGYGRRMPIAQKYY